MQEESNGYVGFACFFLFILAIVVVGTFLIYQDKKEKLEEQVIYTEQDGNDKKKIDKSKEFIYYIDDTLLSESLSIGYKYPIINLESEDARIVTQELKDLINNKKSSFVNMSSKPNEVICNFGSNETIYKAEIVDFGIFSYREYVSLVVYFTTYSCESGISNIYGMQSYTFNILSGEKVATEELFHQFGTGISEAFSFIREELNKNQTYVDGNPTIKIEETMNSLKENDTYILYVDEDGKLILKYIVKTNAVDYNDNISLN